MTLPPAVTAFLPSLPLRVPAPCRPARTLACSAARISPARASRRAAAAARAAAQRAEAASRAPGDRRVVVRIARESRRRAGLGDGLGRVKVNVAPGERRWGEEVVRRVVRIFPEVLERGGVTAVGDGFEGVEVVRHGEGADEVYAEMVLKSLPEVKVVGERRRRVREEVKGGDWRMCSFFFLKEVCRPDIAADRVAKIWRDLGVRGRVYIAKEGVNAQLAVPVSMWRDFEDLMTGAWEDRDLPDVMLGAFLNVDQDVAAETAPFEKLHVRVREKVLADGLDAPLDWSKAGREVEPLEWHKLLTDDGESRPIVLDCRNKYESDVGIFSGAEAAETDTFRETWGFFEERLKDVPRDTPILTYCTGGIRCAKANAWLETNGFNNTGRLKGGIVSYARALREEGRLEESLFKGINHVFDGRLGATITDDALSVCENCGAACTVQTDCANVRCPRPFDARMFVQCPDCASSLAGACSEKCRCIVLAKADPSSRSDGAHSDDDVVSMSEASAAAAFGVIREANNDPAAPAALISRTDRKHDVTYAHAMSDEEPPLLAELRAETEARFPGRAHMVCGPLEAALLKMLVSITGARRVLEIGTFTGYSALFMASALPRNYDGAVLVTCELDEEVAGIAASYFARDTDCGQLIDQRLGRASEELDKMASTGEAPFDLVFLDADKNYACYYDKLMSGLLRVGGLLVVDNVLFRGQVSNVWADTCDGHVADGSVSSSRQGGRVVGENDLRDSVLAKRRLKSLENVLKTARKLNDFNQYARRDPRGEVVMLPIRDGVSLIRRVK